MIRPILGLAGLRPGDLLCYPATPSLLAHRGLLPGDVTPCAFAHVGIWRGEDELVAWDDEPVQVAPKLPFPCQVLRPRGGDLGSGLRWLDTQLGRFHVGRFDWIIHLMRPLLLDQVRIGRRSAVLATRFLHRSGIRPFRALWSAEMVPDDFTREALGLRWVGHVPVNAR